MGQGDVGRGPGPRVVAGMACEAAQLGADGVPGNDRHDQRDYRQALNYAARTIRHSNAVVRAFYEFWIGIGQGPLLNPIPLRQRGGGRANAHHNPLEPFRPEGRIRYNPKLPKQQPREIPDQQWRELFAVLRSNRDRALLALAVSTAARSQELLGLTSTDLDWGEQMIHVVRKGTRARQWLPASPDAFVWIRLYIAELGNPLDASQPLWQTLRRQPMTYDALRKVLTRANQVLGTNYSMHDCRHTAALRMSRDEHLTMRDVQTILAHAHLSTTAEGYPVENQAEVTRRVQRYFAEREKQPPVQPAPAAGYDQSALTVLFGETRKLELGTCGRPYGSRCSHEFACLRCPSLRVDPQARSHLVQIIANLRDRIEEARINGWTGEVDGLTVSLNAAAGKLTGLDRIQQRSTATTTSTHLGIPAQGGPTPH